jgi:enoyl-CoA hydratase
MGTAFVSTELRPVMNFVRVEARGKVGLVTMNRPPVNAVNQEMYAEIRELFSRANEFLSEFSVIVLAGEGRHFCAGNDLDEFATLNMQNSPGRMKLVRETFAAIYDCPIPVIGAVQGVAAGTGTAIAGSCDMLVCGESAKFSVPEVGVGVMGGAKHLARIVPEQVMRRMYFTATPVSARELEGYGGIAQIVPDDELIDAAIALAERMAVHSPVVLRHAKEALNHIEFMPLKSGYELEQGVTSRLVGHPDSLEARAAVLEKRAPNYTGEL